ncbi:hypothetical protein H4Q26_007790 [Puccinia striiformis f. sp. tritici PST-130]|nr:hypothetical protein H4Q26_007790 [Puccinia striiformis f. sp. tritici PST-130]
MGKFFGVHKACPEKKLKAARIKKNDGANTRPDSQKGGQGIPNYYHTPETSTIQLPSSSINTQLEENRYQTIKGTRDHFGYSTTASSLPSSSALILLESEKFKPPQISDSN